VVSAPSGSDLNPASLDVAFIRAPSVPDDGLVSATLEQSGAEGELALAFSAVITREGRISGLEVLENDRNHRRISQLLAGFSRGRLEPALLGGRDPIAVNLVWLVEHMTIKPKLRG
jgi:hypothetical protein